MEDTGELINFFKCLADSNRLKILGLLAVKPLSVEQIAEQTGLTSATVSHHLKTLAHANLVSARAVGYYSIYQFEQKALEAMARRMLAREVPPLVPAAQSLPDMEQKILKNYLQADGRIRDFPVQEKKFLAVLRYVVNAFEPGKRYLEKEVNGILSQYNDDTARLRRGLVEFKLMARQGGGGEYWRIDKPV